MKYLNLLILSMLTAGCAVSKPYNDEKMYDLASQFKDLAQTVDGSIKFGDVIVDSGAQALEIVSTEQPDKVAPFVVIPKPPLLAVVIVPAGLLPENAPMLEDKLLFTISKRSPNNMGDYRSSSHVHLVAIIPPKVPISTLMGVLKGRSAIRLFNKFPHIRKKLWRNHFWARGYFVDTVGVNEEIIRRYVCHQDKKELEQEQQLELLRD